MTIITFDIILWYVFILIKEKQNFNQMSTVIYYLWMGR